MKLTIKKTLKSIFTIALTVLVIAISGLSLYSLYKSQRDYQPSETKKILQPAANGVYALQFVEIPVNPIVTAIVTSPKTSIIKKNSTPAPVITTIKPENLVAIPAVAPSPAIATPKPEQANPDIETKKKEIESFYSKQNKIYEDKKLKQAEINKLTAYLKKKGSPIAANKYSELIINLARQNKADYKILVAIMGIESGFCNANYKTYNCFGYLNGVEYSGYESALSALVPKISREYVSKFGTNFNALAKAYGMMATEKQAQQLANYYAELR